MFINKFKKIPWRHQHSRNVNYLLFLTFPLTSLPPAETIIINIFRNRNNVVLFCFLFSFPQVISSNRKIHCDGIFLADLFLNVRTFVEITFWISFWWKLVRAKVIKAISAKAVIHRPRPGLFGFNYCFDKFRNFCTTSI